MMRHVRVPLGILAALGLMACAGSPNAGSDVPAATPAAIAIDAAEYGRMYKAALQVLRDWNFTLDRQDYRFGVVTTRPRFSPTVAEPWHGGNTTASATMESSFNQQRRIVEVTLAPQPAQDEPPAANDATPPTYRLAVRVSMERCQYPGRYLPGSMDAPALVAHAQPSPADPAGAGRPYWRPIGHDRELERRLLEQIVRRSLTVEPPQDVPTDD